MVEIRKYLFFVMIFFTLATVLAFSNQPDDNAAPYYLKAIELLKYPDSNKDKSTYDAIDDIIKNGYKSKNPQIEEILKNNEPAFKELAKGALKFKCDFSLFAKSLRGGKPNYIKLRGLAKLSTVKGRFNVSKGEFGKASASYLNVVTLAKHLPQQDKLLIAKMFDVALIEIVTTPMKAVVQEKDISIETLTNIDKQLHDYELHSVTLIEVFKAYKSNIINEVKEWLNEVHKQVLQQRKYSLSSSDRKFLYDTTLTEAASLINIYMDYYIKAAQTNNTADWDFAEKEFIRFSESATSKSSSYYGFLGKYWLYSKINKKAALDETAKMQAKMIVGMLLPSGKRPREEYYSAMSRLKEVRDLIAKQLH